MGPTILFRYENFSYTDRAGAYALTVNSGSSSFPHIWMGPSARFSYENFSAKRHVGAHALYCKFETPHISETTRARKLKFYTHLDLAKYSFQV